MLLLRISDRQRRDIVFDCLFVSSFTVLL